MPRYGKCTNVGICNKANTSEIILIVDSAFICPECDSKLRISAPKEFTLLQKTLPLAFIGCILGIAGLWAFNSNEILTTSEPASPRAHHELQTAEKITVTPKTVQHSALIKPTQPTQPVKAVQIAQTKAEPIKVSPVLTPYPKKHKNNRLGMRKPRHINALAHAVLIDETLYIPEVKKKTPVAKVQAKQVKTPSLTKTIETLPDEILVKDEINKKTPVALDQAKQVEAPSLTNARQPSAITPDLAQADLGLPLISPTKPSFAQHRPDQLQQKLALARQKYLLMDKDKTSKIIAHGQPVKANLDNEESNTRNRAANRLSLDRIGIELNGDSLVAAAEKGDLRIVKLLIAGGVPPNIKNRNGQTALMASIKNGHKHIVKELGGFN